MGSDVTGTAGFDDAATPYDRSGLNRIRNVVIAAIVLIAVILLVVTFTRSGGSSSARGYIEKNYARTNSADVRGNKAYAAAIAPAAVASAVSRAQRPTDTRTASATSSTPGATSGEGRFLQYRDYIVAIFPDGSSNRSRITVSDDYRSGYSYYGGYIGRYWTPRPASGGSGSDFRGGGSGTGK